MIDFHSHILPGIDDGAKDVKMSLDMLKDSFKKGVRTVVATPHFYIKNESEIEPFLKKRQEQYSELMEAIAADGGEFPEVILGCEIKLLGEIENCEKLRPFCIENTDYILIEMPYDRWSIEYYDFLYGLIINDMKPIMAHIERFWEFRKEFSNLYSLNLLYQINADSFLLKPDKYNIEKLFREGAAHIVGSDMHNLTNRASHMDLVAETIKKGYGEERFTYLMDNAKKILENKEIETIGFEKMGFFKRMKL